MSEIKKTPSCIPTLDFNTFKSDHKMVDFKKLTLDEFIDFHNKTYDIEIKVNVVGIIFDNE